MLAYQVPEISHSEQMIVRHQLKAGGEYLRVTIPDGCVEYHYLPSGHRDNYYLDGVFHAGRHQSIVEPIYSQNEPVEIKATEFVLFPYTQGLLCYRSLRPISELKQERISVEEFSKLVKGET